MNNKITLLLFSVAFCLAFSTEAESSKIRNVFQMNSFFEKLLQMENTKEGKINILHIGDSHIHADFMTSAIRNSLHTQFGNAGRGFIFPYGTRGGNNTHQPHRFVSEVPWQICRNYMPARCENGAKIGVGGYGFGADASKFVLAFEMFEEQYKFNTIKIITPEGMPAFSLAVASENPIKQSVDTTIINHTVKRGETLQSIAKDYDTAEVALVKATNVAIIKKENNIRRNYVGVGRNLRIPIVKIETEIDTSKFRAVEYRSQDRFVATYHQEEPLSAIYLLPTKGNSSYNLNGIILENDSSGVLYHSIGVPGAQASSFNRTPLFFEQIPVLSPDLIVISLGTNESLSKISAETFIANIDLMIKNIRKSSPNAPIMIMTPPTSLLNGKALNTFVFEYVEQLLKKDDVALWDLYSFTGGLDGAYEPEKINIGTDKIHYTKQGYAKQGTAFVQALVNEYGNYKRSLETKGSSK